METAFEKILTNSHRPAMESYVIAHPESFKEAITVVSHPNKKYLWILSRTPQLEKEVYKGILDRPKDKNFDLSKLKQTIQK